MFSCFPSDGPTSALHLAPRTLVDPLLCSPSEVLQLRFFCIKYGGMSLSRRDTPPRSTSSGRDNERYVGAETCSSRYQLEQNTYPPSSTEHPEK